MTTLAAESEAFAKVGWSEGARARIEREIADAIRPGASVSVEEV
jgi:hypothetical protein